jgi:hypothetical protein
MRYITHIVHYVSKVSNAFLSGIVILCSVSVSAESFPSGVNELVPLLKTWGEDPVIISAVEAQNQSGLTLDAIKSRDEKWRATDGIDDHMKLLMNNAAAKRLLELEKTQPYFFEIFLMDNQGANVAMTNKTSDYWQGDEAKWQASFNKGKGGVHFSNVEFDESAQDYLLQISVPVMQNGAALGAITVGINLDIFEGK